MPSPASKDLLFSLCVLSSLLFHSSTAVFVLSTGSRAGSGGPARPASTDTQGLPNQIVIDAELCESSRVGSLDGVRAAILKGANVNAVDAAQHCPPVFLASQMGHLNVIRTLHSAGADVRKKCSDGFDAFQVAVREGHAQIVSFLLSVGVNAGEAAPDRYSAVHRAAMGTSEGHLETLRTLLREGRVDPSVRRSSDRITPLHAAADARNQQAIQILLSHGANPNLADAYGDTPLHRCCRLQLIDGVRALLQAGARADLPNNKRETPKVLIDGLAANHPAKGTLLDMLSSYMRAYRKEL